MTKSLKDIYISIYSFGYSAGFIEDSRRPTDFKYVTPENLLSYCQEKGFGGIEIPMDRYFPNLKNDEARVFIQKVYDLNLGITVDLENYSPEYIVDLLPLLKEFNLNFFRVKITGIYGGNRYNHPEFFEDFNSFILSLKEVEGPLKEFGIRMLIENHQDIVLDDYEKIYKEIDSDYVGVNWDVGNSLPAIETPITFLNKTYQKIGNIHLKDYKLYKSKKGYRLSRCSLGKGIVDFSHIFSFLKKNEYKIPMTIELGAMNAREAHIYNEEYWKALPEISDHHRKEFIDFIESNVEKIDKSEDESWKSVWERQESPEKIRACEFQELDQTIEYLNTILS